MVRTKAPGRKGGWPESEITYCTTQNTDKPAGNNVFFVMSLQKYEWDVETDELKRT
jgi:hypothetical protein